jgi:hypothetical protein
MARKTVAELLAEVAAMFPNNSTGDITPAIIRSFFADLLESLTPGYAIITRQTPQALGVINATPVKIANFTGLSVAQTPWTTDAAAGTLSRPDFPSVSTVKVQASLTFAQTDACKMELYANDAPVLYANQSVQGRGINNPVAFSFDGIAAGLTAPVVLDVRIHSLTGNASPTVQSMAIIANMETVR